MQLTFPQYISNPMQDKVMTSSNAQMYKQMYTNKLNALLVRENNNINFFLFIDKSKDRYIIYLKVPSESVKEFYYDVVIEFHDGPKNKASLDDYNVRFYSNEPRFCFVFCYSFLQHDLFFEDLKSKMSKMALEKSASNTNPNNLVGYCKSIYFAYLIMQNKNLFSKEAWVSAREYNKSTLLDMVEHASVKFTNRQQVERDNREDKRKYEKLKAANTSSTANNKTIITKSSSRTPTSKQVSRSKKV